VSEVSQSGPEVVLAVLPFTVSTIVQLVLRSAEI
jgi:hypothetical protein